MTNLYINGSVVQGKEGTHPNWKTENGFREEIILCFTLKVEYAPDWLKRW